MKNFIKIFSILTVLVLLCSSVFAQSSKPQAKKFDEINQTDDLNYPLSIRYEDADKEIDRRIARYRRQLLLERAKPYMVLYKSRIRSSGWAKATIAERFGQSLGYRLGFEKFDSKNLEVVDGGYREQSVLEFWIVPPGAENPSLTPTVKLNELVYCPSVYASQTETIPPSNQPIEIKATVYQNKDSKVVPKFKWDMIGGKIVKGSGEEIISVQPDSISGAIKVNVSVEGFSSECSCEEISSGTQVEYGKSRYKIDEFGSITNGDIKARMDHLAVLLQNDPGATGYLITYGARTDIKGLAIARRNTLIRMYLTRNRGIDPARLIFVGDAYRESLTTEVWFVLANGEAPPVTPTVDKKYVKVR